MNITLSLDQKPANDAVLGPLSLTTDDAGSGIATLKLSQKRGRHLVSAAGAGARAQLTIDTLFPDNEQPSRARHSGGAPVDLGGRFNALPYFAGAAALVLIAGFAYPYLPQISSLRLARPATGRRGRRLPPRRTAGYGPRPVSPLTVWNLPAAGMPVAKQHALPELTVAEEPAPAAARTPVTRAQQLLAELPPVTPLKPEVKPEARPRPVPAEPAQRWTATPKRASAAPVRSKAKVVRSAKPTVMARKKAASLKGRRRAR